MITTDDLEKLAQGGADAEAFAETRAKLDRVLPGFSDMCLREFSEVHSEGVILGLELAITALERLGDHGGAAFVLGFKRQCEKLRGEL